MALLVVSDLHIHGSHDPLYRSLLALLRETSKPGDTLVLAGDLFDLFVGRKQVFLRRYREFIDSLREAGSRGVDVHYIQGNHDFLLERAFGKIPGVRVHASDVELEIGGKKFFVSHGDLFDRGDVGYLALRLFYRSPVMRGLVRAVPGAWLDWYGSTHSKYSRGSRPVMASQLPAERLERIRKAFRGAAAEKIAEGFDFVVAGHCHDLDEMDFSVGGRKGQYMNVGYPRAHGTYLRWQAGDEAIRREKLPG